MRRFGAAYSIAAFAEETRMKKPRKDSALDRRQFLAATGGLLAAAVPVAAKIADVAESATPSSNSRVSGPSGSYRKIPIGVFDPVYDHLSLDAMLDKVSALGLEAMEIGTGGYPNNHHCPLDDLVKDRAKAKAWLKKFEDRGIRVATLSCHGNPIHPDPQHAQRYRYVPQDRPPRRNARRKSDRRFF